MWTYCYISLHHQCSTSKELHCDTTYDNIKGSDMPILGSRYSCSVLITHFLHVSLYGFKVVLINKGSPLKNEVKGKPA